MDCPEHEKLKAIQPLSQAVGDFLEWLGEQGYTICEDSLSYSSDYVPVRKNREALLADHFGIDLAIIEKEKRAMLAKINSAFAA